MEGDVVVFEQVHPPGSTIDDFALPHQAPVIEDRSFLDAKKGGFDSLHQHVDAVPKSISFSPNPSYEQYLKMHKVLVGNQGAEQLEGIHESLRGETMPRYLIAAGWAAAEASLVQRDRNTTHRLELLGSAYDCWRRALETQVGFAAHDMHYLTEYEAPYRTARDIAILPLLEGVVKGNVREETCQSVFTDCLNIAQANAIRINLMSRAGNIDGLGEHVGFGYETNALLLFNRTRSQTWFAIPSIDRSDSGHHHYQQTHDLMIVHQKWGKILSMTPVEVKSTAGQKDRQRYKALLVRGKLHLSVQGMHRPEQILESLTAGEEGTASAVQQETVERLGGTLVSMVRDYYAGKKLTGVATLRSTLAFRDNSIVSERHPGLKIVA